MANVTVSWVRNVSEGAIVPHFTITVGPDDSTTEEIPPVDMVLPHAHKMALAKWLDL